MIIKYNLRKERKNKNLTQVQLAEKLDITERQYGRIENGISDGSVKIWKKLAKLFNVTIDYLLKDDSD